MKKNDEKKVALKLINQCINNFKNKFRYADSYKRVEEENKCLKVEIIDLKTNLKINKEIIEGLFIASKNVNSNQNQANNNHLYVEKLKEEVEILNKRNDHIKKENEDLRGKITYYESIINDSIMNYREGTDTLKNKIFVLENAILKKDNLIM